MSNNIFFLIAGIVILFYSCEVTKPDVTVVEGVSKEIAKYRKKSISEVEYKLDFNIPESKNEPIKGRVVIKFNCNNVAHPLIIDFNESKDKIIKVIKNKGNQNVDYIFDNGHIIIPFRYLQMMDNYFTIEFIAGETSLNRNDEFLYTLFVPDRASTAFPCFDQPDLKALYKLTLNVPAGWKAIANGHLQNFEEREGFDFYRFENTMPLSTYLFSFVAGKFDVVTRERNGRRISLYHRETDTARLNFNIPPVFNQVFNSLGWLEDYTGIIYPFAKYEMIAIPSFQYGGMEHTGATLYNSRRIILEKTATQNDLLARANLIAHETSHMWFGDYVTMKWFDDVWLKEVFANFIADKIVNPDFPEVNHQLRFILAHHPRAMLIDRTEGANPIGQQLENMKDAGSLYGGIIYHKSPIVMNMLEQITGSEKLKEGLHEYLSAYAYDNASWDDLIKILDSKTDKNLKEWSHVWVKEPGIPEISAEITCDNDKISKFDIIQTDPEKKSRIWPQELNIKLFYNDTFTTQKIWHDKEKMAVDALTGKPEPDFVLINGNGNGYGYFKLDKKSRSFLLRHIDEIQSPVHRGIAWLNLWESFLDANINPLIFVDKLAVSASKEQNPLILNAVCGYLSECIWKFIPDSLRRKPAIIAENTIWKRINEEENTGNKSQLFRTYMNIVHSEPGIERLYKLWNKELKIEGLDLFENDYIKLVYELAVRNYPESEKIISKQIERIDNKDTRARVSFIAPALSKKQEVRDDFFNKLAKAENREHEPWVLDALHYLHHPLRAKQSEKYILPSLELLEEIKRTGDIFFPKNWIGTTLWGHRSEEAARIVRQFLNSRPDYPDNLKLKILQSADKLFRAEKIEVFE